MRQKKSQSVFDKIWFKLKVFAIDEVADCAFREPYIKQRPINFRMQQVFANLWRMSESLDNTLDNRIFTCSINTKDKQVEILTATLTGNLELFTPNCDSVK